MSCMFLHPVVQSTWNSAPCLHALPFRSACDMFAKTLHVRIPLVLCCYDAECLEVSRPVARGPEQIESESWNMITFRVLHVMSRATMSRHFVSCHFKKNMVKCEMTALSSDDDSADASCHVTSTGNTSLMTYHVRSRSKSSIIIFLWAMHADSPKWPLAVFRLQRQIASDWCNHVCDDKLAHNNQNDVDFASAHFQATHAVAYCCSTKKNPFKKNNV